MGDAEVDRKAIHRSGRPATVVVTGTHLQPSPSLYQRLRLFCGFPATVKSEIWALSLMQDRFQNLNADQEEEIGRSSIMSSFNSTSKVQDNEVELPGFRFHPTDEELVEFYLRRKVEKKPLSIELIKQIDIYKCDPWDLSKSSNVEDKERYFFCKRGRKYRNIIKPNRVTGSGFWKATGNDRPVYSHGGEDRHCIGLKKTLVYYHGSTGGGGETDWMMHEFRLPNSVTDNNTNLAQVKSIANPEAEIWTICRMFQRNVSYRNYSAEWTEMANKFLVVTNSNKFSPESYTNLGASVINDNEVKPAVVTPDMMMSSITHKQPSTVSYSSFSCTDENDDHQFFSDESNWDELKSDMEFALDL